MLMLINNVAIITNFANVENYKKNCRSCQE